MCLRGAAALTCVMLLGCATSRSVSEAAEPARASTALFELRTNFWVSLHQRLYAESEERQPTDVLRASSDADQAVWDSAVDFYRQRYTQRSFMTLLENDELVQTNRMLSTISSDSEISAAELPAEVKTALQTAGGVYRHEGWAADDAANRAFRERAVELLARHGSSLSRAIARAYETPWPAAPMRVDIAAYAGPLGAYTMLDPTHITIASGDRRHIGDAALEILFHEASHALVQRIEDSIARACEARGRAVPPTLWHEVLFYSTGELVRRELGPSYTPYAYRNGLYERIPEWAAAERLLAQHWPAYLDGQTSLDSTIDHIVAGLP